MTEKEEFVPEEVVGSDEEPEEFVPEEIVGEPAN
jgi:hypothetical protein